MLQAIKRVQYQVYYSPRVDETIIQGRSYWGGGGGGRGYIVHPPSIFELNKFQQVQFKTSGILLFTGVQKLYGPEVLPCMQQFLDNLPRCFSFSNNIGEIDHSTLNLLKMSDT